MTDFFLNIIVAFESLCGLVVVARHGVSMVQ